MTIRERSIIDPMPVAPWRIGVDIGGTFTDMVLVDAVGRMQVFKEPSVSVDPAKGVTATIDAAARAFGISREAFLKGCNMFVHGSTVATNTILEKKGAKVGLIVTEGFRDSLEIRCGIRFHQWDHRAANPETLVPRYLRMPVRGRLDSNGDELTPLSPDDVYKALEFFEQENVESIAVTLMNSYANPKHERAVAELIRKHGKTEWLSVSTDVCPTIGEYERTSTTVINAYIAPRVVSYLKSLQEFLSVNGFEHSLLLVQSNGGVAYIDQVAARPINLVLSGPAAGVGALNLIAPSAGNNLVSMEIGGTSCDVILMSNGRVGSGTEFVIDQYHVQMPSIDIHTVGAGGGTIAGVDVAGMLFVGPQGAGAHPGPACYGHGGEHPTVTDAHLVLGRLAIGPIADGSVVLNDTYASEAIAGKIAEPLGLNVDEAAVGIIRLLEQRLLHAVERISTERGYDPRGFTLVAAGGAGPLHGASVGRMLGCKTVYIPRNAGAFCASGMLHSNVRHDYSQVMPLISLDDGELNVAVRHLDELQAKAVETLSQEGFTGDDTQVIRQLDLRYKGQQWSLTIPIPAGPIVPADTRASFEREYQQQFGHIQPNGIIEVTTVRAVGVGHLAAPASRERERAAGLPEPISVRSVYLDERHGRRSTPVYHGGDLKPGHVLAGPLVVQEQTTTVFVGVSDTLEVDASDNFIVHLR